MAIVLKRAGDPDKDGQQAFLFFCPGCKCGHQFWTPHWQFNGDLERPTVSPSILVWSPGVEPDEHRCHSFVRDGQIQFLSDCWHELKGQTVPLPDFDKLHEGE